MKSKTIRLFKNIFNSDETDLEVEDNTSNKSKSSTVSSNQQKKEERKLTVDFFGTDLTDEARNSHIDPVIGRDSETQQVIYTLLRKTKSNPILIGEAGVGKTAIIEGLAQRIAQGDVPEKLKNKRIIMIDMGTVVAGTKYRGEFEARIKGILDEACDPTLNIILFIDEIHTLMGAGGEGASDAANLLKPLLARGKLKIIGATTFDEYQKHIEKDAALKRRFQEVMVGEPSTQDAIQIITGLKEKFEDYHDVIIEGDAIEQAVKLSKRYIMNKFLPDKAIDLIDEACARQSSIWIKLDRNEEYTITEEKLTGVQAEIEKAVADQDYFRAAELKKQEVSLKNNLNDLRTHQTLPRHLRNKVKFEHVGQVLAEKLGIPTNLVTESEIEKIKRLSIDMSANLVGQDHVIEEIVKAVKRSRIGSGMKNKPIASFLFMGPSGVGKTLTAKLIAKQYFGDEKSMIRVDMSDLMEKHSVSKLIGSAPGYVGYDEGGGLTEQVRRRPYSLILFDEIEKASPEVLNIMLQILDEGYLKDNKGRMIDFKNTIIIMTSNIGSEYFSVKGNRIGFVTAKNQEDAGFENAKSLVLDKLKSTFAPEWLNRIEHKVVFKPLSIETLKKIFSIHFVVLQEAWKEKSIIMPHYTELELENLIKEKMYDPQYGARPVEQYMNIIEDDLIEQVMSQ